MIWKIACIQMEIAFGKPKENYLAFEEKMIEAAEGKADVIVLPELWTTGYDLTRLDQIADIEAVETIEFLENFAKKYRVHLVGGSVAKKTEDGIYNTQLVVNHNGELIKQYDKLHLFKLMDEHHYLQPGREDGLFLLEGKQCAGFICYDIRFPEWLRAHAASGAKVLFVCAEWPEPRLHHWRSLLISRAIENQAYVVGVNRVGSDPKNTFCGHSIIIDPVGEILAEAGEGEEIITADIDLAKVMAVRQQIPVFQDRRPEFYKSPFSLRE
jgi:omega-amidase